MIEHLYIHIPFCRKKCPYCNFISYADKENLIEEYVTALTLSSQSSDFPLPLGEGLRVRAKTIYFGGGTPSLLTPNQLKTILSPIPYILTPEISLETNPATADFEKLHEFRKLGVNRLSIGAQSFNNRHLKTLGRIHSAKDIHKIFDDARKAGFENIGIDLMYALPGQTFEEFKKDIQEILRLDPEHISLYNLEVEKNSAFGSRLTALGLRFPDNDTEADMFEHAIESFAKAGYKHYEISNFAKKDCECFHNLAYWLNKNYLGIGVGAHSHVDGRRFSNTESVEKYIGCGCATGIDRRKQVDVSSPASRETIFMGLRLLDGIPKDKFQGFEKEVEELKQQGLLEETSTNIKLTKKGLFLANLVFEKFV